MAQQNADYPSATSNDSPQVDASGTAPSILPGIEHVVVLMFENRSFDNVLGGLYPGKSQAEYNGLTGNETNPEGACASNPNLIKVFQGPTNIETMVMPFPDPGELFNDMNEQLFGCCTLAQYEANECPDTGTVTMSGFVDNYGRQPLSDGVGPTPSDIMQYYAPGPDGCVPVTSALAQAYAVSDQWHASGPVQTLANRFFVHCATPSTYVENGETFALTNNTQLTSRHKDPDGSVSAKSVFELLDEAAAGADWPWPDRTPWKVYFNDWPLAALVKYVDDNWGPLSGRVHLMNDPLVGFFHDLKHDDLPTYSFIEPAYTHLLGTASSNHPGGADISGNGAPISICQGEQLLKKIYTALHDAPNNLFERTLFIVTYDEHGGLYDHVPPPAAVSPFPAGAVQGFNFDRYGVRVPNIFINPFIQPETIFRPPSASVPFDNTSIIATLCAQFGLAGPLTARDAQAPTLAGLIDTGNPLNPFSPAELPTFNCPKSKTPQTDEEVAGPGETPAPPRTDTVAAVIRQAMLSPKNQGRVGLLSALAVSEPPA